MKICILTEKEQQNLMEFLCRTNMYNNSEEWAY